MSGSNGEHVTMAEVLKGERRLGELKQQGETLTAEEATLGAQIATALAGGEDAAASPCSAASRDYTRSIATINSAYSP